MYGRDVEVEKHEYGTEDVNRIIKKKKKSKEEADIVEALHHAQITLPSGKTLKVVTETYHHHARSKKEREKDKGVDSSSKPGNNQIVPYNPNDQDNLKSHEYNHDQIQRIMVKRGKDDEEEEIVAAVLEAERITHSGKVLRVVIETIHNRPNDDDKDRIPVQNVYKEKRKSSAKEQIESESVKRNRYDPRDTTYKELFDRKLLPPLGFYKREDRYNAIREKYEMARDARGIVMTDKYWRRAQNYVLAHLFLWPPPKMLGMFFWSYGYYGDYYNEAHRQVVPETPKHKAKPEYSDSDGGEERDFDDEVIVPIFYSHTGVPRTISSLRIKRQSLYDSERRKSVYPWGDEHLKEKDLKDFHSKADGEDTYNPNITEEKYLAELSGRKFPKRLSAKMKTEREITKIDNDEMEKYIKMWLHELKMISASSAERLNEASMKVKGDEWDGWKLRPLLILEYGVKVADALKSKYEQNKPGESKVTVKTHHNPSKKTIKLEEPVTEKVPQKKEEPVAEKVPQKKEEPVAEKLPQKKSIAWQSKDNDEVSNEESMVTCPSTMVTCPSTMTAVAEPEKIPEKPTPLLKTLTEEKSPEKPTPLPKKLTEEKSNKHLAIVSGKPGEGEKLSIGKLRRGTKFIVHDDQQIDEFEDSTSDEDKEVVQKLSKTIVTKKGQAGNDALTKKNFLSSRIQLVKTPREPDSKEAELWNSLPNNPKLSKHTIIVAPFPKDITVENIQEIFPDATIQLETASDKLNILYATINFSTYEETRAAYGTVRKITFDGTPLMAIPKHKTTNNIAYLKALLHIKK